jgi:hypothetical protein
MRKVLFAVACFATIGLASSRADVTYRYITDQQNYTGNLGDLVPVQILLQEITTGTSTSVIFSDGGLFGAGVRVKSPDGAIWGGPGATADFKITGNATPPPTGFGTSPTALSQTPATATESGLIINGDVPTANSVFFADGAAGTRSVLLGTVNVKIGATPSTLTVTPYGGGLNTITQQGTDLDASGNSVGNGTPYIGAANNPAGAYSFTVAVIPEPSSMALCGLIACGMSYAGYRRRKTTISEEPAQVA